MHEGPVRWIHQTDDAVIDIAGQVGSEMGGAEARAELGEIRYRTGLRTRRNLPGARTWNEDPRVSIALFAGKSSRIDAGGIKMVVA